MKKTITMLAFATGLASASIVDVSNVGNPDVSVAILDNTGAPLAAGGIFVTVGFFDSAESASDPTNFATTFTPFLSQDFAIDASDGFVTASFDGPTIDNDSVFLGEFVGVIFSDNQDLSLAGQAASFITTADFRADGLNDQQTPTAILTVDSVQFGTVETGSFIRTTTSIFGTQEVEFTNGVRLTAVPEPSASLLAGLALVGGLVRRRR